MLYTVANAQVETKMKTERNGFEKKSYLSFNPFGLAELQMAIGIGFSKHYSPRSEHFTEFSYITKTPFYNPDWKELNGIRFLLQYRYHFVDNKKRRADNKSYSRQIRKAHTPFLGLEFRIKTYNFSSGDNFVNKSTNDTLSNFIYRANAISFGGAVLFGYSFNIGLNGRWSIELTAGIGAKNKSVTYKNLPGGYNIINYSLQGGFGLKPPAINEPVGMPYFPCTMRIRYSLK
jgi:hypothetical protein